MKLRKSRLSLAVGVALGAAAMIPATSFGWSVNTSPSDPVGLSTTSGGDTLLFPIYTTAQTGLGQVSTSFSVINSGPETIVAKIRFREQEHSMDVLDFLVVLSPYDNFPFSVAQAADAATPRMSWADATCVVGPGTNYDGTGDPVGVNFPPHFSPFVETDEQMSVGHLEVLGMATIPNNLYVSPGLVSSDPATGVSLAAAAKHGADGVPLDCSLLTQWLASASNVTLLNNSGLLGDVPNDLSGRYLITGFSDQAQGIEGGSDAVGIRDSNLTWSPWTGQIKITSQSNADCVNCLINDAPAGTRDYAWAQREWDHPHLGEMPGLRNFQLGLTADSIMGDWSNNPENFVGVDWVLSFPAKYAYLDYVDGAECDGGASAGTNEWCLLDETWMRTAIGQGYGMLNIWTGGSTLLGNANTCGLGDNQLIVYNREEASASSNVTVSPGGRDSLDVCRELQVFTIAAAGDTPRDSIIQTADLREIINFENLAAQWGWAQLGLNWPLTTADGFRYGDAVSGILFTTRATEDPIINNGSITELQKKTH
jgi:hypothetical protein